MSRSIKQKIDLVKEYLIIWANLHGCFTITPMHAKYKKLHKHVMKHFLNLSMQPNYAYQSRYTYRGKWRWYRQRLWCWTNGLAQLSTDSIKRSCTIDHDKLATCHGHSFLNKQRRGLVATFKFRWQWLDRSQNTQNFEAEECQGLKRMIVVWSSRNRVDPLVS